MTEIRTGPCRRIDLPEGSITACAVRSFYGPRLYLGLFRILQVFSASSCRSYDAWGVKRKTRLQAKVRHRPIPFVGLGKCPGSTRGSTHPRRVPHLCPSP